MKLNKINLSGVSYDLEDLNAAKTVELTQAEYDALTVKDPNTFYVITDAQAADLSNYYTKTETDGLLDAKLDASAYTPTDLSNYYTKSETSGATEISTALAGKADTATTYTKTEVDNAITAATSAKQDTLVSGTNIKTVNNESLLGEGNIEIQGGGATYSAGTNISIDANNAINCTLPISAGTGTNSVVFNDSSNIGGNYDKNGMHSLSYGSYARAQGLFAFAGGRYVNAKNYGEMSVGFFNRSNGTSSAAGNSSGNTLFSVGNGTANNARHNAFEIRQNGDIYVNDGTNDVRLQDTILALGGLKLVKLTQAEYDALATKDSNTLYVIVN